MYFINYSLIQAYCCVQINKVQSHIMVPLCWHYDYNVASAVVMHYSDTLFLNASSLYLNTHSQLCIPSLVHQYQHQQNPITI